MPNQEGKQADVIYSVERGVPVGSIDKSKMPTAEEDGQYPIPSARPVPWNEE
ncbi:MAG: hypothetical protein H0Z34_00505 [Brevibacillus sp.]|nr:hypothetical protein [Brevibacillus sp.]